MSYPDRSPLADRPKLRPFNRLGAVYSALYSFWSARHAAVTVDRETAGTLRDAYSVILFNSTTTPVLTNNFTSTPDELLKALRCYKALGGRDFSGALQSGQVIMEQNWNTKRLVFESSLSPAPFIDVDRLRTPVMIFLSDAGWSVPDTVIQGLCHSAVRLGCVNHFFLHEYIIDSARRNPLSFHSILFGQGPESFYLRKMANVALEIQNNAPCNPLTPPSVPSSFAIAPNTVRNLLHPP